MTAPLTLEKIDEHDHTWQRYRSEGSAIAYTVLLERIQKDMPALLSMARELLELKSALEFLCEQDAMVEAPNPGNDGDSGDTSCCCPEAPALLEMAKSLGWTPPVKGESE